MRKTHRLTLSRGRLLRGLLLALLATGCALGPGCGGSGWLGPSDDGDDGDDLPKVSGCVSGEAAPIVVSGTVRYERLSIGPIPAGLGALQDRPARFVDVEVRVAGGGDCYGRASTDATGAYSIFVLPPTSGSLEVAVFSRTLQDPMRDIVVHENDPPFAPLHGELDTFQYASPAFGPGSNQTVDLTVPYLAPNRPSIGFGVLDTIVTCWDKVIAALGPALPRAHLYTRIGNNAALGNLSFFSPNANAVALLGGAAGSPDTSDTDYFDDGVVAHEFSHFLEENLSHALTRGGLHQGEPLEPAFAWSEGLASGFGCLLLGNPEYIDSTGTSGGVFFDFSVEDVGAFDPPGIGGEFTVAECVWDLGDGGAGPADTDSDGAAVPLAQLLGALDGLEAATDAPYLGLFLDRVVTAPGSTISAAGMAALLAGPPENQGVSYPLTGTDVWPTAIGIGGIGVGTLDSLDGPSKNQCRGITSTAWYHLVLPTPRVVDINLSITPITGNGDLDLFVFANQDISTAVAQSVAGGGLPESINVSLAAGTYIVLVQAACHGSGVRASYALTVN